MGRKLGGRLRGCIGLSSPEKNRANLIMIYYKELAHMVMRAEKSKDL